MSTTNVGHCDTSAIGGQAAVSQKGSFTVDFLNNFYTLLPCL